MNKIILGFIVFLVLIIVLAGGGVLVYNKLLKVENIIIEKDIKSSKFINSQMDIDGGCKLQSKFCFAYWGHYKFEYQNISIPIDVTIEQHFAKVSEEDVFSVLEDKFLVSKPEKGDWMQNYFFVGEDNYGRFVIGWNSGSKLITIRGEGGLNNADYFEDFLTEYINKYPSKIKPN